MTQFLAVITLFAFLAAVSRSDEDQIDYFEELITRRQNEAFNYTPPEDAQRFKPVRDEVIFDGYYDYIVIGSGAAGSVLAMKLTEDGLSDVLVLEAGDFEDDFTDIPSMLFYLQRSKYNWNYNTVPQNHTCLGYKDATCNYPKGMGFGGTTLINGLVYSRGSRADYDAWESMGLKGWSYASVMPFFKEIEHAAFEHEIDFHGTDGEQNIEISSYNPPHLQAFLDANVELGRKLLDYNGNEQIGVSRAQFMTKNGRRMSAYKSYIAPYRNRRNLHLSPNSYVTRIIIRENVAVGVEYNLNGTQHVVFASKEVVLSAGSFGSPHILMLSGIGHRAHLEELNISVVADLPVGDSLQDHAAYLGLNIVTNASIEILPLRGYIEEYLNGTGPFTLPGNNAAIGYWGVNNSTRSEIEIMMIPPNRTSDYSTLYSGYNDEIQAQIFTNLNNPNTFTFYVFILHPKSRGTLRLKSNSPYDYPIIDANNLAEPEDIDTLYYGIQKSLELLDTNAFKAIDAKLRRIKVKECEVDTYMSKAWWYCMMKYMSAHMNHPVGTCSMGKVVDHEMRVYGVERLRVADSSVIPMSISGHTTAPSSMVGLKAASIILNSN